MLSILPSGIHDKQERALMFNTPFAQVGIAYIGAALIVALIASLAL